MNSGASGKKPQPETILINIYVYAILGSNE